MKGAERTERSGKLRAVRIVLTEILIMAVGVLCCIMPMPWRIIVPMLIELRSIYLKTRARLKEPLPHGGKLRGKLHVARVVLTEIIIMAISVMCCIMPMPWRLIVPIIIGTRSILIKAHMRLKEQSPPEGISDSTSEAKEEKRHAEKKTANRSKAGSKASGQAGRKKADKTEIKANNKAAGKTSGQAGKKADSKKAA